MKMRRKRIPKPKNDTLIAAWGYSRDNGEDLHYIWGAGIDRCDARLLHSTLTNKQCRSAWPDEKEWGTSFPIVYNPSFIEELEMRGYDIKTLKFSIKKKS